MSEEMRPYDDSDARSIEEYGRRLVGKCLRDFVESPSNISYSGKGKLGQLVEKLYFQYEPNSTSEPDFPKAGVELKTSPLKMVRGKLVSKERLVLNIINYQTEANATFETSSFWRKNALLLLLFYIHEPSKIDVELVFRICRLWDYPEADLKIIKDDWLKIITKIRQGKAHLLSEGDTMYLAACTKGAKAATSMRSQPYSPNKAKQRAFSLKSKYLNFIINDSLQKQSGQVVADPTSYQPHQTFEQLVEAKFARYYGRSIGEIEKALNIDLPNSKHKFYLLSKAVLGVRQERIAEFEKADIQLKTVRLTQSGRPKESMSFNQIRFMEIVEERWENSYWLETLTKRFFFVVFQYDEAGDLRLKRVFFWTMPVKDLETAKQFWTHTRAKILSGDHSNFIKESENRICHVRPKARDSKDRMMAPSGRLEKKMAYWLNSAYIAEIIRRS